MDTPDDADPDAHRGHRFPSDPRPHGAPMNDENRWNPSEPVSPPARPFDEPAESAPPAGAIAGRPEPGATFSGRTARKSEAVRAGMIVGTGLVVAMGAAVAMGASPAPSGTTGAGASPQVQTDPGPGNGNPGGGRGGFGPFGAFGPFGGGLPGGPGEHGGQGLGAITVTAIDGSSLSLKSETGWTRTIVVPSTATITRGGAAATLADIEVGDTIRFAERRDADGTTTITAVAIIQ